MRASGWGSGISSCHVSEDSPLLLILNSGIPHRIYLKKSFWLFKKKKVCLETTILDLALPVSSPLLLPIASSLLFPHRNFHRTNAWQGFKNRSPSPSPPPSLPPFPFLPIPL